MTGPDLDVVTTERLLVRPPREADRDRFVDLFCNEDFMLYAGVLTEQEAKNRFDHMVAACQSVPFGKQPVVELSSGLVVGYTGVDYIEFEGKTWLEWGYRLVPERRGLGYATEASQALLARAHQTHTGELLAIIAPDNLASQNVCHKLGFTFCKQAPVAGDIRNIYTLPVGENPPHRAGQPDHREKLATWHLNGRTFVLRRARAADVAPIAELLAADRLGASRENAPGTDLTPYHRAFAALDADPAHLLLVITAEADQVVGTMQLTFIPGMARRGALRAQLEAVRIAAAHRGSGLGGAMVEWAIAEARRRDCALVQLTTDKTRTEAHRFYERLGFVASHEGLKLQL